MLTLAHRPKFLEICQLLKKMDRLVPRLRRHPGGPEFAAAWTASRTIRDLGTTAPAEPAPIVPAA